MGKNLKLVSDPKLAKPHEAGTVVELTQPVLHNQFGVVNFITPKFHPYHLNRAEESFKKLESLENKILELPINSDNARMIADLSFLGEIYNCGFDLVVHLYLGFDHFLLDMLSTVYLDQQRRKQANDWKTMIRLNHVLKKVLNRNDLISSSGYAKFVEIKIVRHAFNHPTTRRVYNGNVGQWDEVPLAWIISGKYKKAYKESRKLFEELNKIWEVEKEKYKRPGTLNVQRGIKSLHPVKKK
jgi:hypothetical protein